MSETTPVTAAPAPAERLIRKAHLAKELGVSHAAISRAIRDGRLTPALRLAPDGREVLAYGQARRLWAQCRREPLPQVLPDLVEPLSLSPLPELPELAAAIAAGLPPLHESRARREHYQAELARLELERLQAALVPAAQVEVERRQCAASVRAALASWAERLAPQVAAANDPREIHRLLSETLRVELMRLARPC
jgi:hypothetical protein